MATKKPAEWQAARYNSLADPHERWAQEILDRLAPKAGESILDAGCGSGRITGLLCDRLAAQGPGWSVLGVDSSSTMVEHARTTLALFGEAVEVEAADLLAFEPSDLPPARRVRGPFDAVFSCAVFHWIADHERLFEQIFGWLKPGGRVVAQCGGLGNVSEWQQAIQSVVSTPQFRESFEGWEGPWTFAGPDETQARLTGVGFEDVQCGLEEKIVAVQDGRSYLEVVGLAAHLPRLPENRREDFIDAVLQAVPDPNTLRYIRLNIEARRPIGAADATRQEVGS